MTNHDQIGRFIEKRTPSLERIERFRAMAIMFEEEGDANAARDCMFVVDTFTALRHLQGKPTEPKLGGMDRRGI